MKRLFNCLVFLLFPVAVFAADSTKEAQQNLLNFFAGNYLIIGAMPENGGTYKGTASLTVKEDYLEISKQIAGVEVKGQARLETALAGESKVLRIRYEENSIQYEETCLYQSDLDNYARFSCYVYQQNGQTQQAGLEAYFIAPAQTD